MLILLQNLIFLSMKATRHFVNRSSQPSLLGASTLVSHRSPSFSFPLRNHASQALISILTAFDKFFTFLGVYPALGVTLWSRPSSVHRLRLSFKRLLRRNNHLGILISNMASSPSISTSNCIVLYDEVQVVRGVTCSYGQGQLGVRT